MSNGAPPPNPALEAYKLEYQLAASRYENIYKAIWQIFSYLAAISGALLTFGGDHFQQNLVWVLASFPLVFWFFSTYLPMDRYGHKCLKRLAKIEKEINDRSHSDIKHYGDFKPQGFLGFLLSVRFPVYLLCAGLGVLLYVNGCSVIQALRNGEPLILKKSAEKPISLTVDELKKLMQSPPPAQIPQEAKMAKTPEPSGKKK